MLLPGRIDLREFRAAPLFEFFGCRCAAARVRIDILYFPIAGADRQIFFDPLAIIEHSGQAGAVFRIAVKADQKKAIGRQFQRLPVQRDGFGIAGCLTDDNRPLHRI
jgi:hypothetical protein